MFGDTSQSADEDAMNVTSYARVAGVIFAVVAFLQLARAIAGWPVTIGNIAIPLWISGVAGVVAAALAWLGLAAGSK